MLIFQCQVSFQGSNYREILVDKEIDELVTLSKDVLNDDLPNKRGFMWDPEKVC